MRTARPTILLVLLGYLVVVLVLSSWWPKSVATSSCCAPWGEPVNDLQCRIHADRFVVLPGQRYEIRLELRNTGTEPQVILGSPYFTNKSWRNFRLHGELIGDIPISDADTLTLGPGQSVDVPLKTMKAGGLCVFGYRASMSGVRSNPITVLEVPTPVDLALLAVMVGIIGYRGRKRRRRT